MKTDAELVVIVENFLGGKQMTATKESKGHKCVSGECELVQSLGAKVGK